MTLPCAHLCGFPNIFEILMHIPGWVFQYGLMASVDAELTSIPSTICCRCHHMLDDVHREFLLVLECPLSD